MLLRHGHMQARAAQQVNAPSDERAADHRLYDATIEQPGVSVRRS